MANVISTIEEATSRITQLLNQSTSRVVLGIVGKPGSGKSTLSKNLIESFGTANTVIVPMDGFHLSNLQLDNLNRRSRKGAIDTFDVEGYVSLLERIKNDAESDIYFPIFYREIEESHAAAGVVTSKHKLVITEGNYLLNPDGKWGKIRSLLTESWFVDPQDDLRIERLIKRHQSYGKSLEDATNWSKGSDQTNADLVGKYADQADYFVRIVS